MSGAEYGVRPQDIRRFLDEYGGGVETAVEILTILTEDVPDRMERMRAAYEAGDLDVAAETTHSLISSVGVLGNSCQTETIRELEKELRDRGVDNSGRLGSEVGRTIEHLEEEMETLLSAIEQVLPKVRTPRD